MGIGWFERDAAPTAPSFVRDDPTVPVRPPRFARVTLGGLPQFVRTSLVTGDGVLDAPLDFPLG